MRFRVKNLSSDNHRVEFASQMNGAFNVGSPEPGDVVLSPDGREWNACLAGLKGPTIVCANALPSIKLETSAFVSGKFYLNGAEYELSGASGDSFFDMYSKLVLENPWFEDILTVSTVGESPTTLLFEANSMDYSRVAIEADDIESLNWSQPPSEQLNNESFVSEANVVSFCLLPNYNRDINYNQQLLTGTPQNFNLSIYSNDRYQFNPSNTRLTVVEGDAEITVKYMEENNASWEITANEEGSVKVQLYCAYLVPETQVFDLTAIPAPILNIVAPKLYDWNIKGVNVDLGATTQTYEDGSTVAGTDLNWSLKNDVRLPPYYGYPAVLKNRIVTLQDLGSTELHAEVYKSDIGFWINAVPRKLNVFSVADDLNLGYLLPGTKKVVTMELGGTDKLPEGWTTELVEDLTVPEEVHSMVNWSIDPNDPLKIIINVTGGSYANVIRLRFNFIGPDDITVKGTLIRFQLNTNYSGAQYIFLKYPNDDSSRKEIDIEGVVYGAKIGGVVTIKALDWEMDTEPKNTYTTTVDESGQYKFQLPTDAFSADARRPTISFEVEKWNTGTISKVVYASPRLPLIVKCERNIFLNTSGGVAMQAIVDDVEVNQPSSNGPVYTNLTSNKTDLATIKFYSENPWKGSPNGTSSFYRGENATTVIADTVNPSIREIVSFGSYNDNGKMGHLMFDSITGLVKVPAVIPTAWTTMMNMFSNCKDLNDSNIKLWDVSKITRMDGLFKGCTALTQDLSGWCVTNITSEPSGFAIDSGLTLKPVWGTCPNG